MTISNCKIQLNSGSKRQTHADFEISDDLRCALDWLMLAAMSDSKSVGSGKCVTIEHHRDEILIRIDRVKTADVALGQRIG